MGNKITIKQKPCSAAKNCMCKRCKNNGKCNGINCGNELKKDGEMYVPWCHCGVYDMHEKYNASTE